MIEALPPQQAYQRASLEKGFVDDPAQIEAVALLDACYRTLHESVNYPVRGVYLWGPVGRGKTWLMDLFHHSLRVPARRQHFHHFMQWVHRRLFALSGRTDPLKILAAELAGEVRVLCFDELFVSDIGDAMLLGGLFQLMFEAGVTVVATSNQPPEQLYAGGFNRQRFLPAIAALQANMEVIEVDGGRDHRLLPGEVHCRYWVSDTDALPKLFARISEGMSVAREPLMVNHRPLQVEAYCGAALWLNFDALCGQPFGSNDFIALCDRFPAILLGAVPRLSAAQRPARIARGTEDGAALVEAGDRELPALSIADNSVRRFIALVDECYDRRVPLYIEAAVALEQLYTEGALLFPFRRTLSRLQEMQLQRFGADR